MSCSLSRENLGGGDVHENGDSQCDFATPGDFTSAKYATYRAGTICFTLKSRTVQNKISNRANVCAESTSGRDQCSRHRPSVHFRQTNSACMTCMATSCSGFRIAFRTHFRNIQRMVLPVAPQRCQSIRQPACACVHGDIFYRFSSMPSGLPDRPKLLREIWRSPYYAMHRMRIGRALFGPAKRQ
jgi:hypothetical protein